MIRVAGMGVFCMFGVACGPAGSSGVDTCPNDVPASCPDGGPSYAAEVAPLIEERCGACHTSDGVAAVHPFDTYEQVRLQRTSILLRVHACLMPPADQMQLTPAERQTLFGWIVCGATNN